MVEGENRLPQVFPLISAHVLWYDHTRTIHINEHKITLEM